MAARVIKRLFTVTEYHRMAEAGILSEDDRVELINGEIVQMAPIGSRHQACVDRLTQLLFSQAAQRAIVRVQGPIHLAEHTEPQPDITLLKPRPDFYAQSHPSPEDILLLIEVTETHAAYDREVKVPLYARFGVQEVWVVDPDGEKLEVFSQPSADGYRLVRTMRRGEAVSPLWAPDLSFPVDAILG